MKTLLLSPSQHIEKVTWGGMYIRITRHYLFLFFAVYFGWLFKLISHVSPFPWPMFIAVSVVVGVLCVLVFVFRPADGGFQFPFTQDGLPSQAFLCGGGGTIPIVSFRHKSQPPTAVAAAAAAAGAGSGSSAAAGQHSAATGRGGR